MTLINQAKQAASGVVFLFDVGDTCSTSSWVCHATQGRAPFLVMDAMGYDAAIIGGPEQVPIPITSLRKLTGHIGFTWIVWDRQGHLTKREITVTVAAGTASPLNTPAVQVKRADTRLPAGGDTLPLIGDVAQGDLLRVDLAWPDGTVQATRCVSVGGDTPADPTISAIVDLIESEAKQHMQPRGDDA